MRPNLAHDGKLLIVDIVAVAFGEAINKNCAFLVPKGEEELDNRPSVPALAVRCVV